jgi:glycosyltransferase involved in cell wall biosynthesis
MKVGLVTTWAECGAGYVSKAYARVLAAAGIEVRIYGRGQYLPQHRWTQSEDKPWDVVHDRCVAGLSRVDAAQFNNWIRDWQPDWLIFNEQRSWAPVLQAKDLGVQCAAYIDYYRSDSLQLFDLYDLLFCHTKRHFGVFASDPRAIYIPWGVDTDYFSPGPRQRSLSHSDDPLVIVHSAGMGGPNDRKGTDLALKAFARVKGPARLLLHSQLPLDQLPQSWTDVIDADSRIEFLTGSLEPRELYRNGDLYLYPSRLEGIGLTLPEAMACGLAAITTDAAPMNEFVQNGFTGMLVPVAEFRGRFDGYYWPEAWVDPDELGRILQSAVDSPLLVRNQGASARSQMVQNRHWPIVASTIHQALGSHDFRPLDVSSLPYLRRQAKFQDRRHEPLVRDLLEESARTFVRHVKRRFHRSVP